MGELDKLGLPEKRATFLEVTSNELKGYSDYLGHMAQISRFADRSRFKTDQDILNALSVADEGLLRVITQEGGFSGDVDELTRNLSEKETLDPRNLFHSRDWGKEYRECIDALQSDDDKVRLLSMLKLSHLAIFASFSPDTSIELADSIASGYRDKLTGLYTRPLLMYEVERLYEQGEDPASSVLMTFDVVNFREINNRNDHGLGNDFIRGFGTSIEENVETNAKEGRVDKARMGGDEFGIVISGLKPNAKIINIARLNVVKILSPIIGMIQAKQNLKTAEIGLRVDYAWIDKTRYGSIRELYKRADAKHGKFRHEVVIVQKGKMLVMKNTKTGKEVDPNTGLDIN